MIFIQKKGGLELDRCSIKYLEHYDQIKITKNFFKNFSLYTLYISAMTSAAKFVENDVLF
jgi:hypothetical protein